MWAGGPTYTSSRSPDTDQLATVLCFRWTLPRASCVKRLPAFSFAAHPTHRPVLHRMAETQRTPCSRGSWWLDPRGWSACVARSCPLGEPSSLFACFPNCGMHCHFLVSVLNAIKLTDLPGLVQSRYTHPPHTGSSCYCLYSTEKCGLPYNVS